MQTKILLINNQLEPPVAFERCLHAEGASCEVVSFEHLDDTFVSSPYDCAILTGTDLPPHRHLAAYERVVQYVRKTEIPTLGVCGGHLILALSAGGMIVDNPAPIYGRTQLNQVRKSPLFRGMPDPACVFAKHRFCVAEPPPSYDVLAREVRFGLPYVIAHRERPMIGVQFHPERRQQGIRLLTNFLNRVRQCQPTGTVEI